MKNKMKNGAAEINNVDNGIKPDRVSAMVFILLIVIPVCMEFLAIFFSLFSCGFSLWRPMTVAMMLMSVTMVVVRMAMMVVSSMGMGMPMTHYCFNVIIIYAFFVES